jgi:hypothetical protein
MCMWVLQYDYMGLINVLLIFRWVGWIKEYDGGTLMECYIHPGVNYLRVPEVLETYCYCLCIFHDALV